MSIPKPILSSLPPDYAKLLEDAAKTGDFKPLEARLNAASERDDHMKPYAGQRGVTYYKSFVQTVVPRIIPALKDAIKNGVPPEIKVTFKELDERRESLGIPPFGSPQDVLYGFSSERYEDWGPTLEAMCFRSACMDGVGSVSVTMGERYLRPGKPDEEILELSGAIGRDFWSSAEALFSHRPPIRENIEFLAGNIGKHKEAALLMLTPSERSLRGLFKLVNLVLENPEITGPQRVSLELATMELKELADGFSEKKFKKLFASRTGIGSGKMSQEQIALKYAEEGKYLQKLLNGKRVEHFQSNVKMVTNPLRDAKCEIDGIYRVTGDNHIVLVEAKGKDRVSRTQLYQAYETFRLKLPLNWKLTVVAILMSEPSVAQEVEGVRTVVDVIDVAFDDGAFGKITESLALIKPARHIRWKIKDA